MLSPYKNLRKSASPFPRFIPAHWQEKKLSQWYQLKSIQNNDDEELLSVYLNRGVIRYSDSTGTQVHKPSEDLSKYKLVEPGDFVLNNQQAWRGSVGISEYRGIISPAYYVWEPRSKENLNPEFMNYMVRDRGVIDQFVLASKGVGSIQRQIYVPYMKETVLAIPPLREQIKIVDYLNWKIGEMDRFIAKTKREIRRLKELKESMICYYSLNGVVANRDYYDSEYPWIGKVPVGWKESKVRNVLRKLSYDVRPEDELLICSNSGKVFFRGDSKLGLVSDSDKSYQGVRRGDLLIHGMDTWHGAIAVSPFDGKCTTVVHVCDSTENKSYLAYYLQTLAYKKVYKKISSGVRENTSDFRSWAKAGDINVVIPSRAEQDEIVSLLDDKCGQIDVLIEKLNSEISFVEELKAVTISDVVTGKVDVRDVEIPEYETETSDIDDNVSEDEYSDEVETVDEEVDE